MNSESTLRETPPAQSSSSQARLISGHEEWIIDESIEETFPASDPISPARPGSLVSLRYAVRRDTRALKRNRYAALGAVACALSIVCLALLNRRKTH